MQFWIILKVVCVLFPRVWVVCHSRAFESNLILLLCLLDTHKLTHAECALSMMSDDNDDDELFFSFNLWTHDGACFMTIFPRFLLVCLTYYTFEDWCKAFKAITISSDFFSNFIIALIANPFLFIHSSIFTLCVVMCFYFEMKIFFYYFIRIWRMITNNMRLRMQ